ncbi:MAG: SDR family oxidoreductase [Deltaproteobacteria bacterium]|nr:SDR family oxidoreductase [Deltaproteobacteria bacterium]
MGKIAFVTGASRGIGHAIGKELLAVGCRVALGYLSNEKGAGELADNYEHAIAVQVDVSCREAIRKAVSLSQNHFGGEIDILVNNGAIAQEKPFSTITDSDWDNMLATNLRGPFVFCQEVVPGMLKNRWGRIVNIVSIGGQWGGYNQVHYAAAKAGLINLTQSLAKIYSKDGITANAVSPGLVATDMTHAELSTKAGKDKVGNIPMGRTGTVAEVACVVRFLCSEEASYITGQTINVNGGMYFG